MESIRGSLTYIGIGRSVTFAAAPEMVTHDGNGLTILGHFINLAGICSYLYSQGREEEERNVDKYHERNAHRGCFIAREPANWLAESDVHPVIKLFRGLHFGAEVLRIMRHYVLPVSSELGVAHCRRHVSLGLRLKYVTEHKVQGGDFDAQILGLEAHAVYVVNLQLGVCGVEGQGAHGVDLIPEVVV